MTEVVEMIKVVVVVTLEAMTLKATRLVVFVILLVDKLTDCAPLVTGGITYTRQREATAPRLTPYSARWRGL